MDWKCGTSSRVPALKAQSPKFKPQPSLLKKKNKRGLLIHAKVFCDLMLTNQVLSSPPQSAKAWKSLPPF
jgi:hypothetical protein